MVLGIVVVAIILYWLKNKSKSWGYLWTFIHLLIFMAAIFIALDAFRTDYTHPMASEENSLRLGIAGVVWSISMLCFVIAIYFFSKTEKSN
ncbi:hypothetical protein FA727_04865 [Robertmurraya kyonggiensis]|uniref:Uncharacterized protein n=1 Tax=Robertmurraya kyonggiensis TaxID=1037680 RepID=A0A4U1DC09_9BACI|nr:hypothetical protein FA727_04865 [Robertmurraya kyonggiensis]